MFFHKHANRSTVDASLVLTIKSLVKAAVEELGLQRSCGDAPVTAAVEELGLQRNCGAKTEPSLADG